MRPRTLAEVAALAARGDSFDRCLANFLDEFYAAPNAASLADTPVLLGPQFGDTGRLQDAYLFIGPIWRRATTTSSNQTDWLSFQYCFVGSPWS